MASVRLPTASSILFQKTPLERRALLRSIRHSLPYTVSEKAPGRVALRKQNLLLFHVDERTAHAGRRDLPEPFTKLYALPTSVPLDRSGSQGLEFASSLGVSRYSLRPKFEDSSPF
jgi:hypothetical protein